MPRHVVIEIQETQTFKVIRRTVHAGAIGGAVSRQMMETEDRDLAERGAEAVMRREIEAVSPPAVIELSLPGKMTRTWSHEFGWGDIKSCVGMADPE